MDDVAYMRRALRIAANGAGWVNPNPQVGAVIVRDQKIIGEGWHTRYGCPHAEREALADCARRGEDPAGATIYVTLEPCCHQGKQPPCTQAIIDSGIARVVMGAPDPNPLVAGKGVAQLREAGIVVDEGVLEDECRQINQAWMHYITTGRPYVTMKYAMTLDGKIAAHTGDSKWITSEAARERVHQDRAASAAILVGIGTVLADDPALTARIPERDFGCERTDLDPELKRPHSPLRIVLDTQARTPLDCQLVTTCKKTPTLIVSCDPEACGLEASGSIAFDSEEQRAAAKERIAALRQAGAEVLLLPEEDGHPSIPALLDALGQRGVDSLMVEGGSQIHGAFLAKGLVNCVQAYIAPKLIGGAAAPGPVGGEGFACMADALVLAKPSVVSLGDDVLIESEVLACSPA